MARREYYRQAIYHVYNRGNNRLAVLKGPLEKEAFLKILNEYQKRFKFKIYGLVLMDNHYHMVLQTEEKATISKIMHAFIKSFGHRYRKLHKYTGHLWESRFKSRVIENEVYMLECLQYMHDNPVKAGLVNSAENYLWSSYRLYEGMECFIAKFIVLDAYTPTLSGTS